MRVEMLLNRRPSYFPAILLVFCIVLTQSCRKVEQPSSAPAISMKEVEAKFFNNYRSANATESALVNFLSRRNDSSHFVENAAKRIGYPRWDKSLKFNSRSSITGRAENNSSTASITFIPFVRDSQNYVNALMAIRTTNTDTSFKYLCDWQYADTSATHMAPDVFALFMIKMDNHVLDNGRYTIKDSTIFTNWATKPASIDVLDSLPPATTNFLTPIYYTICFITYGPLVRCGWLEGCTSGQEDCWKYCRNEIGRTCFDGIIWEDDGDWGSGGDGTGSGGGNPGNGGGDPPPGDEPPPCGGGGLYGRRPDPCGPGWEPLPNDDPPPPPCDSYITALGNDLNFANQFKSLADTSIINLNYEKGFIVNDRIGNSYQSIQGDPTRPFIRYTLTTPANGILHTHCNPVTAMYRLNPMFSPEDVLDMARNFLAGMAKDSNNFFIGLAHGYGPPYLLKITNVAKFRKFAERIVKMESNPDEGKRFTAEYKDKFWFDVTEKNERGFLNMLDFEKVGNGLTLYRAADNDCRKWKKLERDGFNQTGVLETPCN